MRSEFRMRFNDRLARTSHLVLSLRSIRAKFLLSERVLVELSRLYDRRLLIVSEIIDFLYYPWTYREGWHPSPIRFFLNFFKTIIHEDLPFSVTVRISLTQVRWESVATVTRFNLISHRWSSHIWINIYVFSFLRKQAQNAAKKPESVQLCHILHV